MSSSRSLVVVSVLVALVAVGAVDAAQRHFAARPPTSASSSAVVETRLLANGKTHTRVRIARPRAADSNPADFAATPTNPPFENAKSMIFVISDFCKRSLNLTSQTIFNGGWAVPPPPVMTSFFEGAYSGFEAKANPGQDFVNGSIVYTMGAEPDVMSIDFFIVPGEWGMDVVWATAWQPKLFSSEYEHKAVYNLGLGDMHFQDKPIC